MQNDIRRTLEDVQSGKISVDEALMTLKTEPFNDLGYAKVDMHRKIRQGVTEVIYGEGKSAEQISGIVKALKEGGQNRIIITRLDADKAEAVSKEHTLNYYPDSRIGLCGGIPEADGIGTIVVATGGTSDIPVAEEAAITAEALGNRVIRLYDVGVSGLHRVLGHKEEIMEASVVIAVAGMEGALPSVISGFSDAPVIAVPTSIGYGASFGGLAALLAMINSCASGVSVVNIDNGFGAGYIANMINHVDSKRI